MGTETVYEHSSKEKILVRQANFLFSKKRKKMLFYGVLATLCIGTFFGINLLLFSIQRDLIAREQSSLLAHHFFGTWSRSSRDPFFKPTTTTTTTQVTTTAAKGLLAQIVEALVPEPEVSQTAVNSNATKTEPSMAVEESVSLEHDD